MLTTSHTTINRSILQQLLYTYKCRVQRLNCSLWVNIDPQWTDGCTATKSYPRYLAEMAFTFIINIRLECNNKHTHTVYIYTYKYIGLGLHCYRFTIFITLMIA